MKNSLRGHLLWILAAAALGLAASVTLSALLHWTRAAFVSGYSLSVAGFATAYVRTTSLALRTQLRRRWRGGILGGVLLGLILWQRVLSQPASNRPEGVQLALAVMWFGLVYGTADAVLLNILPVLIVYRSAPVEQLSHPVLRLRWAGLALIASELVTALYHVGFTEFQGYSLIQPLVGNAIITLGYLLTGSPLTPLIAHLLMHVAAVLHGMEATPQLPPHY